ncbi:hypothetical protein SAMN02910344_01094 [Ruminobacter amylophilus]|jgi:hypothetical protein|uniref:Uncharacterized protein n=1 Tax=Ruminobacter amylophilus TaxID=867 RepID=A0A662ZGU8_9GAMM|nr:hypothetical protein [Ruminobacter amylophilus]SFP32372.1 hypothetical protein SAMN02910344_01094 [Ruminobacter amylophilus]
MEQDSQKNVADEYEDCRRKLAGRNDSILKKHINEPDFGLVPEKPVFLEGIAETSRFLDNLTTSDGTKVYGIRKDAAQISGIAGLVDCYVMYYKKKGIFFRRSIRIGRIYVCEYCNETTWLAPRGYSLSCRRVREE